MTAQRLAFRSVAEEAPGPRWASLFQEFWPSYRRWFLSAGDAARPSYLECERALKDHLPEWLPTWRRLSELAGGGDLEARFLSGYRPPPYVMGCSQAVWEGPPPMLVRNYDYHPDLCEGVVLHTRWNGKRVIASSDSLSGALDGMNEDGLAVSLAFGGRRLIGDGFGAPQVLRYLLEFCSTVREASEVLARIPMHMAYNILVVDRSGEFTTAFLTPGSPTRMRRIPASTNHQDRIVWTGHARATATLARENRLVKLLEDEEGTADRFRDAFLAPPLYNTNFARGFGTLYTAAYRLESGRVEFLWPQDRLEVGFDRFAETSISVAVSPTTPESPPKS